ncbi:MAG: DUF1801 domain-containing protein [Flavobacteriales bacterium]
MTSTRDAESQFATFLAKYTPELAAQARALRKRMRARYPHAHEMVYDNYNALVIGYCPSEKPSEAILSLAMLPDHVSLCFLQNAGALRDPRKLLQGSGNTARHIKLKGTEELDDPSIIALMEEAERKAKRAFDPDVKGRLIIRSVSAKQRPRKPE